MFFDPFFVFVARMIVGLLFIFTAVLKIMDLRGFYLIFLQYGLFSKNVAKILAYVQPFVEFIIGLLLIYDSGFLLVGTVGGIGLMLVATFFVVFGYVKKLKMQNCGCYGTAIESPLSIKKIVENIIWILVLVYVFLSLI